MGLLIDGKWHDQWYDTKNSNGEFVRADSVFRSIIEKDGEFEPEAGRYHLYVSLACPWAHRAIIFRKLKGLENIISMSIVKAEMLEQGWELSEAGDPSPVQGINYLHQVYTHAEPKFSGRVTVPVLWDKKTQKIVNNESAEIIRILNSAFNELAEHPELDLYPKALRSEIDSINDKIYHNINNGVYKAGFATTQAAYDKAFVNLFNTLDELDQRLEQQRFLCGSQITEADWRLFTTLVRFDSVYVGHFKCNLKRISDYPNLAPYLRDLYQQKGVAETVDMDYIKTHYYYSHDTINPHRIVPLGPELNLEAAHNREQLSA